MQDDNLSREELLAESVELRRRVEKLEAENFSLREQISTGAPPGKTSDRIDDPFLENSPEFREIEDHYRAVVESASEAICITQDGVLKFCNPASTQLTGYSNEELLSRPFAALTHPEDLEDLSRIYLMRLRGELVPPGHRFRIIAKDGEMKWVESWSASIEWKGRPAVLSMIRDVTQQVKGETLLHQTRNDLDRQVQERTAELQAMNYRLMLEVRERERAELSVRESEDRFKRLMEHSPMGVAVTGMNGEMEYLNKKFIQLFGYTLKDIPTLEHWWHLAYPDPQHADRVRSEWLSATREAGEKGTEAEPVEREVRCKDGRIRVIDFRKTVIDKRVIHTFHDVTDSKRQEQALLESEQMFRLLSEQSLMSVAILQDGIYKYANQAMSALCEYSLEEILNWGPEEFLAIVHPADRGLVIEQARMKQTGDARQKPQYEFRIITKSGITKCVEIYSKTVQFKGSPANLLSMLDLTKRKKAEDALRQSEYRCRSLVETSPDPIILYDLDGNLITVNQQAATAYGVESPEQLLAEIKNVSDILDEESQKKAAANLKRTLATGSSRKSEYTIIRKDGSTLQVEINSSMVRSADGAPLAFISVVRDITDRKRVEQRIRESEERLRLAWDTIPDALSISRLQDGTYVDVNNGYTSLTGYTRGEVVGKSALNLPFWDDLRERQSFAAALTQHGHVRNYETRLRRKDGETRTILISAALLMLEGEQHLLSVTKDIEDLIRTQEALSETEARYKRLVETTDTGFVELDSLGKVLQVNDPYVRMAGASKVQELIGRSVLDWTAPECLLENDAAVQLCVRQGHISDFETTYLRADGSRVRILIDATTEDSPEGPKIVTLCRDITERKLAEEALKLSELTYREIFDTVNDTIWIHDIETFKFVDVNNKVLEMFGYSVEEALDLGLEEISSGVPPFIQATAVDLLRKAVAGEPQLFEWHARHKDDHLFWTEVNLKRGTVAGKECILAIERDITERKRTEEALRAKTEELDLFFTAALDLLCIADTDGYFRRLNPEWQTVLGYPLAELEGKRFLDFVHPEDLENTLAAVSRLAGQETVLNFTNRYRCQDGSYRWIEWRSYPAGKVIYAAGRDITERRCAEELIRENLTRLQTMVRNTPIVLYGVDRCGVFTLSEGKGLLGMGLKPGEIVGRSAFDVYRDRPDILENFRRALAGEAFTAPMKAGSHVYDAYHEPVFDEDGEYAGTLGVLVDVTERKRAEQALRESEERFFKAFNSSPAPMTISEIETGRFIDVNDQTLRALEFTKEEMIGHTSNEIGIWDDPEDRTRLVMQLHSESSFREFPVRFITKSGNTRDVLWSAEIITIGSKKVLLSLFFDITERKRAEEALRESEERLRLAWETSPDCFSISRLKDGVVIQVNAGFTKLTGYTGDEVLGRSSFDFHLWADPDDRTELISDLTLDGEVRGFETKFRRKDGEIRTVEISAGVMTLEGEPHFLAIMKDIEDSKQAQAALARSEELFRKYFELGLVGMALTSPEKGWVHVNDRICEMLGYTRDELLQTTWTALTHPDDLEPQLAQFNRMLAGEIEGYSMDKRYVRKDGELIYTTLHVSCIRKADGTVDHVIGHLHDITDRKRAEEALRSSEERYASVMAATQDGIFDWDLVRGSGYASERWQEIHGLSRTNFPSIDVWKRCVHPDDLARVEQRTKDLLAGRTPLGEVEYRIRDARGHEKWVLARAKAHFDAQGHAIRMIGTLTDITERKKVEERLGEKETLLESILDASPVGINYVRNRQMLWSNRAWEKMFGFEHPDEYVGKSSRILYQSDEDYESAGEAYNRAISHDITTEFDAALRNTDGSVFSGNVRVRLMQKSHPDNFEAVVSVSDISNRKKAEEALKTSRHRLDQIIEFLPDPTVVIDDKGKVEAWNRAMEHLTGVSAESILGKGDFEHALPFYGVRRPILADLALNWDEGYLDKYISIARRAHGLLTSESYHPTLKGGIILSGTARALYDSTGQPVGAIETLRDVTEIKKGNEENLRLKKYVENIINSMPSMLVGVDRECRVTQWNTAAENMTGVSAGEARGKMLSDIMPMLSKQLDRVHRAIRDRVVQLDLKVPRTTESGTRYEDITVFPLASNGVEGAVIRVDDVTERVRIEEMMIQTEKMMSVGGLAAGMAHEVNNPLGVIMQATQNVLRRLSPELPANVRVAEECGLPLQALNTYLSRREIVTFLEDIRSSGQRAAEVVSNMLSFSRKSEKAGSSKSLSELLDRTLVLAGSDYDLKKKYDFRQIEIVREYDANAPEVVCQAGKIQQVFLNILRNGAEAMQENRAIGRLPKFILRVRSEGEMVRVEIEDNGPGMEESIRRRVFEPFFTTKAPGVGTGLGMSVSYFIISDDHGGTMEVESSPGNGARLIIRLPVQGRTS